MSKGKQQSDQKPVRIVLAEDTQMFLDGLAGLLNQEPNFEVVGEAINGKQALKLIKKERPNLAILDIDMPVMTGIEVAKEVKKMFPEMKILILSLYNEEIYVKKLMELGVDGYMLKERGRGELVTAVKTVMEGKRFLGESVKEVLIESQYPDPSKAKAKEILTKREQEILILVAKGNSSAKIADKLSLSEKTVNTHRRNIRQKLQISGPANFLKYALLNGYMRIEDIGDDG